MKALRMLWRLLRGARTNLQTKLCAHQWEQIGHNCAKRRCVKCGEEQWLFENYPWSDKPRYEWKTMHRPNSASHGV
jgi:hypothetical protein